MSELQQVVFLKRSGDLTGPQVVEQVRGLQEHLGSTGGVVIVPGGGSGGRGREMTAQGRTERVADTIGRLMTLKNALETWDDLNQGGVESAILAAGGMRYADPEGIGELESCSPATLRRLLAGGQAGVIAFGSGRNKYTTDAAVWEHANNFAAAYPDVAITILKAMTCDGVCTEDPKRVPDAKRYARISAGVLAATPAMANVLDEQCLRLMQEQGSAAAPPMLLFNGDKYSPAQALQAPEIGTLVVAQPGITELVMA
jgi:uridylate kinase